MPERPIRMENNNHQRARKDSEKTATRRTSNNFPKKKEKFGRKRSKSFTGGNGKFCAPYTCRKRPMLPTKFLLGGNICDPLNLNSLQDEEVNRTANAVTPKSSPIPTPPQRRGQIDVLIPPNINDPLNLIDCDDDVEYEQQLMSPYKKGGKRRKKKKRTTSATTEVSDADISSASEAKTPDKSADSAKIPDIDSSTSEECSPPKLAKVTKELKLELSPQKEKKRKSFEAKDGIKKMRRLDSMDKIVSPVVPQPGAWIKRPTQRGPGTSSRGQRKNGNRELQFPKFKPKNQAYQYGNYNRYYGYRNPNHEVDPRLKVFANYQQIFEGKDILDIGCNIGHITLSVARDFGAKSIVGLDIDKKLIGIARKNIRHYVNCSDSPRNDQEVQDKENDGKGDKLFPISMPILYGPVDIPGMTNERKGKGFPHNVTFVQGNYVLSDDAVAIAEQTQFDVILCLSVTKWMHLNWGDTGLKQAFKRMYAQLRPGGKLILEPQSWASYKQKKTLTPTIYKNYHSIKFFPEKFTQYLLSSEVGFAKSEIMGHPHHFSKGFQRPIQIFTKSDLSPSQSQRSYTATPLHTIASNNPTKPVYTSLTSPSYQYNTDEANNKEVGNKRGDGGGGDDTGGGKDSVDKSEDEVEKLHRFRNKAGQNRVGEGEKKGEGEVREKKGEGESRLEEENRMGEGESGVTGECNLKGESRAGKSESGTGGMGKVSGMRGRESGVIHGIRVGEKAGERVVDTENSEREGESREIKRVREGETAVTKRENTVKMGDIVGEGETTKRGGSRRRKENTLREGSTVREEESRVVKGENRVGEGENTMREEESKLVKKENRVEDREGVSKSVKKENRVGEGECRILKGMNKVGEEENTVRETESRVGVGEVKKSGSEGEKIVEGRNQKVVEGGLVSEGGSSEIDITTQKYCASVKIDKRTRLEDRDFGENQSGVIGTRDEPNRNECKRRRDESEDSGSKKRSGENQHRLDEALGLDSGEWEEKINREIERRFEEELNNDARILNESELKKKMEQVEKDLVDDLTEIKNKLRRMECENDLQDQQPCKRKHEPDQPEEVERKHLKTEPVSTYRSDHNDSDTTGLRNDIFDNT